MKKIYFLILTSFLFIPFGLISSSSAQQNNFNWRVGLETGNMTYRGDLNEKFWQQKEMFATDFNQFSFGLSIENTPNKTLSNRLQLTYGEFTANDRNTGILARSLNVQTKIYSAAYIFTFYTDNGWLLGENAFLSPYLMAGIGGTYFENYGDLYYQNAQNTKSPYYYWSDNTIRDAVESSGNGQIINQDGNFETRLSDFNTEKTNGYSPYSLTVPVGVGLKLRLLNRLSLHVQSVVNYAVTSDFLDDVSGDFRSSYESAEASYVANPANYNNGQGSRGNTNQGFLKNDAFIFTSFGISWSFSPKKQAFRAPALYAANKPKSVFELNPDSLKTVTVDGIPDYSNKNSEINAGQNQTQDQNNQNNQNQNGQNQNPYNYNQNGQYPYQNNQNPNPVQTVKIDINVNVTTTKSGSDSSITKVVIIPQNGQTVNGVVDETQKIEQEKKEAQTKTELEEMENRLKEIEDNKGTRKTRAEQKADKEAQEQARLEMEKVQNQLEELKKERQNNVSITLENPNQASNQANTQKQDSAMYKLMELQFMYMQQRMAALEKQLKNQEEDKNNSTQDEDLSKITQQLNTLQTQLELLANQKQNEKIDSVAQTKTATKDTVVVMNKDQKTPTTSEVVGIKKVEIFFKTGSSTIVPKDKEKIAPLIAVLQNDKNLSVRIYGFTDSKGSAAFNQKLSKQRTEAVKKMLLDAGISETRIVEGSFGIDTNNPYGEDFYGRRVEIELVGK